MEHLSLRQLSMYPLTTHYDVKAIRADSSIRVFKGIVYFEYLKRVKYLQYLNMHGYNVYFFPRPQGGQGGAVGYSDFLLDDIDGKTIERLKTDNLTPLYCLETSPKNYQAVLRFNTYMDKEKYLEINRYFVQKYNADPASVGTEHFFRLAGFTNRKEKYFENGLYPFVHLKIYGNLIDKLPELPSRAKTFKTHSAPAHLVGVGKKGNCDKYISTIYSNSMETDVSMLDWKAASSALAKGFNKEEIILAITRYSPDLPRRKKGHVEDYILRTVDKAYQNIF